jgi:Na+-translocating ferredoxin:NAD+ oxidoreductase RnfD subunit
MLAACTAIAATDIGWLVVLPGLLAATAAAVALDVALHRWRTRTWTVPDGALLTGWLVALVLTPFAPWWIAAATSLAGIAAKHAWHEGRANVLNPAAAGLVLSFYLFDSGESWWGALPEVAPWWTAVLIALGAIMTYRLNKSSAVLAFLGVFYTLATLAAYVGDPTVVAELFRAPDLQATIFLATFMLTDPPTSPPRANDQWVFGGLAASVAFVAFAVIGAAYFLLAGVLAANVWEAARKRRRRRTRPVVAQPVPTAPTTSPTTGSLAAS